MIAEGLNDTLLSWSLTEDKMMWITTDREANVLKMRTVQESGLLGCWCVQEIALYRFLLMEE